jgi:hypothetical protein
MVIYGRLLMGWVCAAGDQFAGRDEIFPAVLFAESKRWIFEQRNGLA